MPPTSTPSDSRPLRVLMASIICFGLTSAYFVLNSTPQNQEEETAAIAESSGRVSVPTPAALEPVEPIPELKAEVPTTPVVPAAAAPEPVAQPVQKQAEPVRQPIKVATRPTSTQKEPAPARKVAAAPQKRPVEVKELDVPAVAPVVAVKPPPVVEPAPSKPLQLQLPETYQATVRPTTALPLVPAKPSVVLANKDKAWVKLDERTTVIVNRGDSVPGLGKLLEADGKSVKFEKATVPVTTE